MFPSASPAAIASRGLLRPLSLLTVVGCATLLFALVALGQLGLTHFLRMLFEIVLQQPVHSINHAIKSVKWVRVQLGGLD